MFHLTSQERLVLIFLVAALAVGAAVKVLRGERAPPPPKPLEAEFDLAEVKPPLEAAALAEAAAPEKINVNAADAAALCALPGIGPAYAARVVAYRESHGPFEKPEDLAKVKGIGPATVEKIAPYITCAAPE
ncbi:MAG TPA: helix-hairpin-helix domain-containing protein [bacterium]|nr:helix-hairpin-helix domain-containing protein [bacterium]